MKFHDLSIQEMQRKLLAGELTSVELTQQCLQRIRATDGQLNASGIHLFKIIILLSSGMILALYGRIF